MYTSAACWAKGITLYPSRFLQGVSLQPPERRKRSDSAGNRCFMCKKQFSICSPPAIRDEKFAGNLRYQPFVSNELLLSSSFTRHAALKFTRNSRTFEYEHGNSHWVIWNRQSVEWERCVGGWRGFLKAVDVWRFRKSCGGGGSCDSFCLNNNFGCLYFRFDFQNQLQKCDYYRSHNSGSKLNWISTKLFLNCA